MYCLPYAVGISPTLHIRGMVATVDIKKGAIIERCPVILVPKSEQEHLFKTKVKNYFFDWTKKECAVVLGYGSLVNHSFTPNAIYKWDYKGKFMLYVAISDIKKGEEVLINYNGIPNDETPLDSGLMTHRSY